MRILLAESLSCEEVKRAVNWSVFCGSVLSIFFVYIMYVSDVYIQKRDCQNVEVMIIQSEVDWPFSKKSMEDEKIP